MIGLDRSVVAPITLSDGTSMEPVPSHETLEDKARRDQQKASRCKRRSNRRRKRVDRLSATRRKRAMRRKGRAHAFTTKVVGEHSVIATEAASVPDLTASAKVTRAKLGKLVQEKADVNRRILNVVPCQTRQMPKCKAARWGGTLIKVEKQDTAMPCSACESESDGPGKSRVHFV